MEPEKTVSTDKLEASRESIQDKKIQKQTYWIYFLIFALPIIAVGIVVGRVLLDNGSEGQNENSSSQQTVFEENEEEPTATHESLPDCSIIQNQAEIDICETVTSVSEYLASENHTTNDQIVRSYEYSNYGPKYHPDYLLVATTLTQGEKSLSISFKGIDITYNTIEDFLLEYGFSRDAYWDISDENNANFVYVNDNNGVICDFWAKTSLSCSHINFYPHKDSEDANLINELADTLIRGVREGDVEYYGNWVIPFSVKDIKNSEITPYQTIGSGSLSFYRTGPNSKWVFGYSALAVLMCEDYTNDDMRKAYASDECTNSGSYSPGLTVKEYYNL